MSSFLFLFFSFSPVIVTALQNITVDDTDPSVVYLPSTSDWEPDSALASPLDYGGAHALSVDPNATATFTFTGVAVYFMSPLWPYTVNTAVSLDSGAPFVIDLTDHSRPSTDGGPETVQSQVVWGSTGLQNTTHTLVASMASGGQYVVVDGFIYTTLNDATASGSSSGTPTSTKTIGSVLPTIAPARRTGSPSSSNHTLAIVVGSVVGFVALVIIICIMLFCNHRRDKRNNNQVWADTRPHVNSAPSSVAAQHFAVASSRRVVPSSSGSTPSGSLYAVPTPTKTYTQPPHRSPTGPYGPLAGAYRTAAAAHNTPPQPPTRAPNRTQANTLSVPTQENTLSTITETSHSVSSGSAQQTPPAMYGRELPPASYAGAESSGRAGSSSYGRRESVAGKSRISGSGGLARPRGPPAFSPML